MESSNYYTFCSTEGKLFYEAFYWKKEDADEFKQNIHKLKPTILSCERGVLRWECLLKRLGMNEINA